MAQVTVPGTGPDGRGRWHARLGFGCVNLGSAARGRSARPTSASSRRPSTRRRGLRHRRRLRQRRQRADPRPRPAAPARRGGARHQGRLRLPRAHARPSRRPGGRRPACCAASRAAAPRRRRRHRRHGGDVRRAATFSPQPAGRRRGTLRRLRHRPHRRVPTARPAGRRSRTCSTSSTTSSPPARSGASASVPRALARPRRGSRCRRSTSSSSRSACSTPRPTEMLFPRPPAGRPRCGPVACSVAGCSRPPARPGGRRRRSEGTARSSACAELAAGAGSASTELAVGYVRRSPQVSTMLVGISSERTSTATSTLMAAPPLDDVSPGSMRCIAAPAGRRLADEPDVVVIGSGPCGAMAASRARRPRRRRPRARRRARTRRVAGRAGRRQHRCTAGWAGPSTRPTASTRRRGRDVDWYLQPVARRAVQLLDGRRAPVRAGGLHRRRPARRAVPLADHLRRPRAVLRAGRAGPDGHRRRPDPAASRPNVTPLPQRLPADWQRVAAAATGTATASARCRWPRAGRGWSLGGARSSAATTASSRRCSTSTVASR